jgi:hypothetical protein
MKKNTLFSLFMLTIFLFGCTPAPQAEVISIETIVAATYSASVAQTEAAGPPESPTPLITATAKATLIPSITPTATATYIVPTFTPIPTATPLPSPTPGRFGCKLISQSPNNGASFEPREEFRLFWTVENAGTKEWIQTDVKYFYLSGEDFHKREIYGIPETTRYGETVTLRIDMVAPRTPGSYETTWAMKRGLNNVFCETTFKFKVE